MTNFLDIILKINIWQIGKVFVLIGLGVYIVFAFIVVRQVKLMTEVVSGLLTELLRFVSLIFFVFAVFIFIFTLLFL